MYTKYWLNRKHPDFRMPYVYKIDSDDYLEHKRIRDSEEKVIMTKKELEEWERSWDKQKIDEAEKSAREFLGKWKGVENRAIERKAKELFEKWKKKEIGDKLDTYS
jgi:hypothetical protein